MSRALEYVVMIALAAALAASLLIYRSSPPPLPSLADSIKPLETAERAPSPFRKYLFLNGRWEAKRGDGGWEKVPVPGIRAPGPGARPAPSDAVRLTYRRGFRLPGKWRGKPRTGEPREGKRTLLHLPAGFHRVGVVMNGRNVGEVLQWGEPAAVDLTGFVSFDTPNQLELVVDSSAQAHPALKFHGWRPPEGLGGDVFLELLPAAYIERVRIDAEPGNRKNGRIRISAGFGGEMPPAAMVMGRLETPDRKQSASFETPLSDIKVGEEVFLWEGEVEGAKFWSPEAPNLYRLNLLYVQPMRTDGVSHTFGFREITAGGGRILLNGRAVKLDGVSYFPDPAADPQRAASALTADLRAIKRMGFNAVRFFPAPPPDSALDECDRLGLLALVESPVAHLPPSSFANGEVLRVAGRSFADMVRGLGSHPSVAMWGLGGGLPSRSPEALDFAGRVAEFVEEADARPLYVEAPLTAERVGGGVLSDGLYVAAIRLDGLEETKLDSLKEWRNTLEGKPAIVIGYGARAVPGRRERGAGPETEERQLADLKAARAAFSRDRKLDGWFFHSFADYPDPAAHFGTVPYMRLSGLVARNRVPKLAFEHLAPAGLTLAGLDIPALPRRATPPPHEAAIIILLLPLCLLLWAAGGGLRGVLFGISGPEFALKRNLPVEDSSHVASWTGLGEAGPGESGGEAAVAKRLQPAASVLILFPVAAAVALCARALAVGWDIASAVPDGAARQIVELFNSPYGIFHAAVVAVAAPLLLSSALSAAVLRARPGLVFLLHARAAAPFLIVAAAAWQTAALPWVVLFAALWHLWLVYSAFGRVFGLRPAGGLAMAALSPLFVCAAAVAAALILV